MYRTVLITQTQYSSQDSWPRGEYKFSLVLFYTLSPLLSYYTYSKLRVIFLNERWSLSSKNVQPGLKLLF